MATNHTKGKWTCEQHTPNTWKIENENKISELARVYADTTRSTKRISYKEAKANAKIIAAAPDMHELLNRVLSTYAGTVEMYSGLAVDIENLIETLQK